MKKFLILFALLLPSLEIFAQKEKNPFTATLYGGIYLNNDQAWSIYQAINEAVDGVMAGFWGKCF